MNFGLQEQSNNGKKEYSYNDAQNCNLKDDSLIIKIRKTVELQLWLVGFPLRGIVVVGVFFFFFK